MNDHQTPPAPVEQSASGLSFPVVGLGASAGGIGALLSCLENLPAAPGMAFVVILHLSPKHESNAAAVLQRATRMQVCQVRGTTKIEPDHVYVIPPTHSLLMYDGHLALRPPEKEQGRHVAIDLFFRTLAEAHKERAIVVVLSGTGSDGSAGLSRVKEEGGVVIAQSPNDAEYNGMPSSAIATGKVDIVLPAAEIPQKLIELRDIARQIELPRAEDSGLRVKEPSSPQQAEEALRGVMAVLQTRTGHDFKHYKRATVLRRVERRMQISASATLPDYLEYLKTHPAEPKALLSDMLIGVTNFFRDREAFEALDRDHLPHLLSNPASTESLRAWSAGCSTGEEAYSLAILLSDAVTRAQQAREVQVFASDIDEESLAFARQGKYPDAIVADVPPHFLRGYFNKLVHGYQINEITRKRVLFAAQNLLRDPPFSRLDLVSCRNLLIYLDRQVQADVLRMFHFALRPGGLLLLGSSETADALPGLFESADKKNRIYRSVPGTRVTRTLPQFPLGGTSHHGDARVEVLPRELRKPPILGELHQRLAFEDPARGSVVVGKDLEILHLSPNVGQFLRFSEGNAPRQLMSVLQPELRLALRAALLELDATHGADAVNANPVAMISGDKTVLIWMSIRRAEGPQWPDEVLMVTFMETANLNPSHAPLGDSPDAATRQLEQELHRKDELLQKTIEQAGTTTEDLKASNEELQAINEELRSATEELETSKEELQSTNEELLTVNVELKATVEETSQVNDDLQNLMRATEIATVFVDPQLRIKRFTPMATTIFNLIDGDVGRSLLDITHKLEYPNLAADAEATFATLRMVEREVRSIEGRWFLARMLPYRTGEDRIDGAVLSFVDISGRLVAETRMLLGEERMQLVAASIPDFAILTMDPEGKITSWSKGAENLFGYSEADSIGQPFAMIFTPEERAAGVPEREMKLAAENGRTPDERWHVRKDGTRFFASGTLARMTLGSLRGFAKIAHDSTAQHERQGKGMADMAAAEAASVLKDEFLAVMSHELKHPLNLIHVNAQLLLNLPETKSIPAVRKASETIERSVTAQARIIDDLLDLSRAQSGRLRLDLAPVDFGQAIDPCLKWAAEQSRVKGLQLAYEAPEEPLMVIADVVRLEQVVMNLLSNALKFTASGGAVRVRLFADDGIASLEVADNGRGISPAFLPHVFNMFEQEERDMARREGGLGIGLGLAHQLMTLQGGDIEARSPGPGRGATFTLRLPLHDPTNFVPFDSDAVEPSVLTGLRILAVDDDADSLETFTMLLTMQGAHVITAHGGVEALRLVETTSFDLLLSDIGMPLMDGKQLIAAIRRSPSTEKLPAIAMTGYGRPQDVQSALAAGFSAHLTKPVDMNKLFALVTQLGAGLR